MTRTTPDDETKTMRVQRAMARHNTVLSGHAGSPISYGIGIYILCSCQKFKGTVLGWEEHYQRMVIDAPVRA